jgi:membrane protein DedA with SNARE-associated domain
VLFTFATGGSNPLLLGLMGGLGLTIGDGIYFLTGRQSQALFTPRIDEWSTHISQRITKLPTAFIPIGVFIYAAFTPLPNDILMITLALTDVTYSHVLVPLVLGNITLITALSIGVVVW